MTFQPGIDLSRNFFREAVRPVLDAEFAGLPHSAALLGRGSEVLGFDDEMSADHNHESRVLLFLTEEDHARHGESLQATLNRQLPAQFAGHPTYHGVFTLRGYVLRQLGFNLDSALEARDWLTFSEQSLLMFTAGEVFHDDIGLHSARDRFSYYPDDVWHYLLLAGWWRIHPEANQVGRTGFVGDELGSAVIGARLVHDLIRLCFLLERQYAPYDKWLGTAFSRLDCGPEIAPLLWQVVRAETWQARQRALLACYRKVGAIHNALAITPPVAIEEEGLWGRPFTIAWGDFPGALRDAISDPAVTAIADAWPVGGVDRLRDVLWSPRFRPQLLNLVG